MGALPPAWHLPGTCLKPAGAKSRRARSSDGNRFQCADTGDSSRAGGVELALLESQAWELEEKDLQHLETLCSSDTCKVEIVRRRARSLGIRRPQIWEK